MVHRTERRYRAIHLAVVTLVLGLASCTSGGHESKPTGEVNAGLPVPPEQAWAFEGDGEITASEYQQGFDDFKACATEHGVELIGGDPDPDTGLIGYGTPTDPALKDAADRCYQEYFQAIDATYQTTNPAVVAQREREAIKTLKDDVFPCLKKNGIDVPEVLDPAMAGDPKIMDQWVALSQQGRC